MITNTGKEIIAKYLIGTAPAFASYLAVGCGARPRTNTTTVSGVSSSGSTITAATTANLWVGAKVSILSATSGALSTSTDTIVTAITNTTTFTVSPAPATALVGATLAIQADPAKNILDFEMFRVPITSRGFINENGINKIVLTAELPTEERYEISEVGIFSAGSNPDAGSYDSKTVTPFASTEKWQFNDGSTISDPVVITEKITNGSNNIISAALAIQTNSNNLGFLDPVRAARYERCRYLNNIIMLRGNTSSINESFTIATGAKYLQLTGQTIDFSRNSTSDLLKIAFSLINVNGNAVDVPTVTRVVVEFSNSDGTQYARLNSEVTDAKENFGKNRYFVVSKRLDQLVYSSGSAFSWKNMTNIKIYTSALSGTTASADYFIALDAIRLDNIGTVNPLYGMTGYSIVQNNNAETVVKLPNSNNYMEFRIISDVT